MLGWHQFESESCGFSMIMLQQAAQPYMSHKRTTTSLARTPAAAGEYDRLVSDISRLLEQARRGAARSVNAILTATYWQIGRRIVEHEQGCKVRAEYGEELLVRLSADLMRRLGEGLCVGFDNPGPPGF